MARQLIGFDLEMTGTDWQDHRIIQVGFAIDPRDETKCFGMDVGWAKGDYRYDPESLAVIKWDFERIEAGPPVDEVEQAILEWFEEMGIKPASIIPVGFAVKTFDMPFFHNTFPKLREYFIHPNGKTDKVKDNPYIYRTCDLTDYTLGMANQPALQAVQGYTKQNKKWGFDGWKKAGKKYAEDKLAEQGETTTWHDALYDAKAAMFQLEYYNLARGMVE